MTTYSSLSYDILCKFLRTTGKECRVDQLWKEEVNKKVGQNRTGNYVRVLEQEKKGILKEFREDHRSSKLSVGVTVIFSDLEKKAVGGNL